MPCYYTGTREGDAELAHSETSKRLQKIITNLTQLLCALCQNCDENCYPIEPLQVAKWWKAHKKVDAKRRKEK